ncbi:PREDICTED: homeobox protein BEL1 homolog [Fragaria vesca subsp. vesca]|uniref:homeobox protein BEL1 homolog n=1 Tax=Fragaria vesca subsp. vesca TaxID=101020 RepID=UPI0002C3505B|nr:PREDICTED: homeobox protein BEL1 homolog [Fragaria vesca subsp. vesca]XP_011463915.1 PREDICTED: homeobox protein BEL1 homolog [Fragaria vesca subsp. vesca]
MARELCSEDHKSSSVGFCYSDVSSANPTIHHQNQFANQIQGFDQSNPAEIFNLTTGMEMIGFSKGAFFSKHGGGGGGPSSSKGADHFYHNPHQQEYNTTGMSETSSENQNLMESAGAWHQESTNNRFLVDDSSLRCVFPCEGNERPSQGLSLSLSSSNPSSIGLQSFELRQTNHHQDHIGGINQSHMILQDGYLGKSSGLGHQALLHENQAGLFQLRNSKYLGPAQELLNEFCSLGTKQTDALGVPKHKSNKTKQWEDQDNNNGSASKKQSSLYSLEFVELQKRKTRLLQMLEEVERRYKHYCDQMKAVVATFETVAGAGAATVYSKLASKAMSRHFRSLKDGIVAQIQETRKAMGEKDPVAPGASRGETPRLRILDQTLRQQRAFQQMNMMESHPWRPQRGLPERSVSVLRAWLFEHFLHPYPSDVDKHILARQTGLSRSQVSNWFINARVRLWKPMVEEMYMEETKEHENNINMSSSDGVTTDHLGDPSTHMTRPEDQKPTQDQLQLVRIDSECLSSIITNNPGEKSTGHDSRSGKSTLQMHPQQSFGRVTDAFGSSMELDFTNYNQNPNQSFNGGGHGVSLTLGLNQHGGTNGVSLAFSPSSQSSLFYPRDHIEECQPVQYSSLLDGEGQNNLPYRNLMGAQLLHDLAG